MIMKGHESNYLPLRHCLSTVVKKGLKITLYFFLILKIYLLSLEMTGIFTIIKNFRNWRGNTGSQKCVNKAIIQVSPL